MKKAITLVMLSLFIFGCSNSNEDRAKKLVTDFLKTELDDFNRYEPIDWGTLDSVINVLESDAYYIEHKRALDSATERLGEIDSLILVSSKSAVIELEAMREGTLARQSREQNILDKYKSNYEEGFTGYTIEHAYRAPNKVGALEREEATFFIDKNFKTADYKASLVIW